MDKQNNRTDSTEDGVVYSVAGLFRMFATYGYEVRRRGKQGDRAWSSVKNIFQNKYFARTTTFSSWGVRCQTYFDQLICLGTVGGTTIDEKGNELPDCADKTRWEPQHFLLQHGRIVKNNLDSPSLMRLCQIAFNSGQMRAVRETEPDRYTEKQLSHYDSKENGTAELSSYISDEDLNKLDMYLSGDMDLIRIVNLLEMQVDAVDDLPEFSDS
jgi:hypothetical protein